MNKIILFTVVFFALVCLSVAEKTRWFHLNHEYSFDKYVEEYSKTYETQEEFEHRKSIFENRLNSILKHNADPQYTWKKGINHLSDRTENEFRRLLGYEKSHAYTRKFNQNLLVSLEEVPRINRQHEHRLKDLPPSIDWRQQFVVTSVKDQGQCGSCWSFASAETIESAWAIAHGNLQDLSEQQILDCTPNPEQCGGTGGCGGGTTEIAFANLIKMGGIASEWTYPYTSYQGNNQQCAFKTSNTPPQAVLTNYTVLESNAYAPLLEAVATVGPIAISIDASAWSDYESGVFNGCNQTNPDIDHAVQLVGYGTDPKYGDYWLVRNSWGPFWGEEGYLRIMRTDQVQCGTDINPLDGTGCKDGPATVTVCGTCGILFDSTYVTVAASL